MDNDAMPRCFQIRCKGAIGLLRRWKRGTQACDGDSKTMANVCRISWPVSDIKCAAVDQNTQKETRKWVRRKTVRYSYAKVGNQSRFAGTKFGSLLEVTDTVVGGQNVESYIQECP